MEKQNNTKSWTDEEVQTLISIWSGNDIQREFESAPRNKNVYQNISTRLAELGVHHSVKQCREKIKKLKQDYKRIKDHNNQSDSNRRTSKWFDALDTVLGPRPTCSGGGGTNDSATALLEDIKTDSMEEDMSSAEAVKRKRASCSSEEWKKIIVDSDQQYVGVLHSMLETETQHREEELQMKREEIQHMKEEASTSSALQGQLVCVLGQIAELFKAKQVAPHANARTLPGRNASSSTASQATRWEAQPGRALHARTQSRAETGAAPHQTLTTESYEENHPREMGNIIKIETEELFDGHQRTGITQTPLEPVPMQCEESRTRITTQEAAAIAVQRDLLAAQREQCRLMAENNSIQRTLVRAVSRGNRCVSDLAKSIRAQTAVSTGIQDRIVQLLERQEWTNQLLTMKVMGGSSTSSQNPQEARKALSLPNAGSSSAYQSSFSGKESCELPITSSAADQCNS